MAKYNESITLRSGVTLKNRLVLAPMTVLLSFYNGIVTKEEIEHYAERSDGMGMVITATANVTDNGKGWPGELTVANDDAVPGLRELAKAIQEKGAKAVLQMFHAGRMSARSTLLGEQVVSASAYAAQMPNAEVPRELTNEEILEIIDSFGQSTKRAIDAGFDGVEIHGANLYLIQQFFSPHSNRRTDKWGGTIEKRYRFLEKIIDTVFETVQKHADRPFIVGYRFSPIETTTPGIRFEDTLWLVSQLREKNFDYLHVSLRMYDRKANDENYQEKSELGYIHDTIQGKIPLISVGGVRTRKAVEGALVHSEMVAVGQQMLVDPQFAVKLAQGRDEEFVSKPFGEAIHDLPMPNPMLKYLEKRY